MAHDGQDLTMEASVLLPDLLSLTGAAVAPVEAIFEKARAHVRELVVKDGRVSAGLVEANQDAAHGLAWLATYLESLRQMQGWAERMQSEGKFGELEQLIHQIAIGEYLGQIRGGIPMNQGEIMRPRDFGVDTAELKTLDTPEIETLLTSANTTAARMRLVELMQEQQASTMFGASGLDEELEMIREQFRRYAVENVIPHAHDWHLKDELIPMEIIEELAEMGVFGLTIPEEYGGFGLSKASMCVVSEEL